MELIKCEALRAKISLAECRIRKEKAAQANHHDYTVPGLTYSFQQCLDCEPEGKKRVEVEIMGEGKRKYTMSEAALKARKETAIKAGAKRSRKISSEGYTPPPKEVPCCVECGIKCTDAETFDIKAGLCGECMQGDPSLYPFEEDLKIQEEIAKTCDGLKKMLLEKNRKYGNSALNPVRVFSRADPYEQINVRIDDKLSRLKSAQADEDEDVVQDLIGYLILRTVAKRMI